MKFICMDLKNFRQYKTVHLDFSVDDEKNVTLVLGDNGAGKTTFVQAFYWCFYDFTSFEDKTLLNSEVLDEAPEGKELEVEVKILVQYGKTAYEIKRVEKYEKNDGKALKKRKIKGDQSFTIKDKMTNKKIPSDEEAIALIERMLPHELSKYFFFDGETMDVMSEVLFSRSKSTDIASVIQSVVGLRSLQQLIKHLKQTDTAKRTLIRKINDEIDLSGGAELKAISKEIDSKQDELNRLEIRYKEIEDLIKETHAKKEEISVWLSNHPSVVDLENEIEELEREKKECAKNRDAKAEVLAETMKLGREKRLQDWLYKLTKIEIVDLPKLKDSLSEYDMSPRSIRKLIDNGKCICGASLEKDTEHRKILEDLLSESENAGKYRDLQVFISDADKFDRESIDSRKTTESIMDEFEELNDRYLYLDSQIKRKREEMAGRGDEVKQKLNEQDLANTDIATNERNKEEIIRNRSEIELKILELEKKRSELRERNKESDFFRQCLKMAEEIYQQVANAYSGVEVEVRDQFCECFQRLYDEIYASGWSFEISDKYEVQPSRKLDQSQGQKYSMVLAFIGTALTLAGGKNRRVKKEEQMYMDDIEQYPLVMDAPLSAFDSTRIRNISNVMPEIVQQWIIFIKDTDGVVAQGEMKDLIGVRYTIRSESRTNSILVRSE